MSKRKPIIGLVGGIGSGKTFVAKLFGEVGCVVVDSDAQVREAYQNPAVIEPLRSRWGGEILHPAGTINRAAVAQRIFTNDDDRKWLEQLLHPLVNQAREAL